MKEMFEGRLRTDLTHREWADDLQARHQTYGQA